MYVPRFALVTALLLSGLPASAQDKDAKSPAQAPALDARQRAQKAFRDGESRLAFEMRKKPWSEVMEWLVDQSGLNYIATQAPPAGTFNFISPKGSSHSGPEVIDIINEGLLQHQYVLVRRARSFALVSADKQVDPSNVARIAAADLKKRGETELVQILVSLQILSADEYAPDVKKQMGPHGSVVPLPVANQLIMTDTAGNLLRILETIDGIEKNNRVIQLERGSAATLAVMLQRSLREIVPGVDVKIMTPGFERPLSEPETRPELKRSFEK